MPIPYPAPRVSQLDAGILDTELLSLLKEQLSSIFLLQSSKWWSYSQHPELWNLVLNILVFKLTVWKNGSSYGLSLQNLKLTDFRTGQKIGYRKRSLLLGLIIAGYLYSKLESYLYASEEGSSYHHNKLIRLLKEKYYKYRLVVVSKVNDTLKVLNLLNFTVFLINGKYPSLVHRVLGISLTPIVSDLLKFNGDNVNFEFQNRQLVWNVMTEFLVFILPLLQLKKLRKMTRKLLSPPSDQHHNTEGTHVTPFSNLPVSQCAICHHNSLKMGKKSTDLFCLVTNPYVTNCGHIYCYVCLATRFNAIENGDDDAEPCLRCGVQLKWFEEYGINDDDVDNDAIIVDYETNEIEEEKEDIEDEESNEDQDEDESNEEINENNDFEKHSDYSEGEEIDQDELEEDDVLDEDYDEGVEL